MPLISIIVVSPERRGTAFPNGRGAVGQGLIIPRGGPYRGRASLCPCLSIPSLLLVSAAAVAQPTPGELALPFSPACVSSPFGARGGGGAGGPRASRRHTGIDLPAAAGTWVHAAAAGQVVAIRRRGAAGLEVALRHPGGFATRYAHRGTVAPAIASGRRAVARGESLGRVGRSGITYGTHLHFEVLVGGAPVDPARYLSVDRCDGRGPHRRE